MNVLVFGAHSRIGEHVIIKLAKKNHRARAIVGNENLKGDLLKQGAAEAVVYDDRDPSSLFEGIEAVIYLTGVNPKGHTGKTVMVDHQSVIETIRLAEQYGIKRFVMLSAVNADEKADDSSRQIGAKELPDDLLRQANIAYTIIQPATLVDTPGSGKVQAALTLTDDNAEIAREDLAEVLVESLQRNAAFNKTFEVSSGGTPVPDAINALDIKED